MDANGKNKVPDSELISLFRQVFKHMARTHHRTGRAQHAQQHVLSVLAARSPLGQRALLNELDVRSASLSEVLSKLERQGLITRERDDSDRRNFIIRLTEEGRSGAEKYGKMHDSDAEMLFSGFTDEERACFAALLRKLNTSLEESNFGPPDYPHDGQDHHHGRGARGRGEHLRERLHRHDPGHRGGSR